MAAEPACRPRAPRPRPAGRRAIPWLAVLLALAACGPAGRSPEPETTAGADRPSLLLVTIDTWRWDHIGVSGAGKVETPNLDRLAREGTYEREIVTPCPLTTPAHASLFTGLNPPNHGVLDCTSFSLPQGIPTIAESFRGAGYRTAAFVGGETVKARYGLDRGFEVYDDTGMTSRGAADWHSASREGSRVVDAVLAHLSGAGASPPVFLWVHFFDPHLPYRGHQPFFGRHPGRPYAAEVAYVDAQIGRLVAGLPRNGAWRIVIVGDHGEGLGDHGETEHGYGLYRSTIHVPLIFHPAPERPLRHARPWGLVDLVPTLRAWFALPGGAAVDGEDLFKEATPARVLPTLSLLPSFSFGVQPTIGARQGNFNYLRHREEEFYDLSLDPGEGLDRKGDPLLRGTFRILRQAALAALAAPTQQALDRAYNRPSDEEQRTLASLGYLGGGGRLQLSGLPPGDLTSMLKEIGELDRLRERAFLVGETKALRAQFRRLCREYPNSSFFLKNYGTLSLREEDFQAAADAYRRAVSLDPADSSSMTNWGGACMMLGRWEEARDLLERSLALDGTDPLAHKNLAVLYARNLGRPADALPHLERYLQLQPDAPDRAALESWMSDLRRGRAGKR